MRLHWSWMSLVRGWKQFLLLTGVVLLSSCTVVTLTMLSQSSAARTAAGFQHEDSLLVKATLPSGIWAIDDAHVLRRLPDTAEAGTFTEVKEPTSVHFLGQTVAQSQMVIASNGGLGVHGSRVADGTGLPGDEVLKHDPRHVLVGTRLASEMGIGAGDVVRVAGHDLFVDGLVTGTGRRSVLATAVIVAPATAARLGLSRGPRDILLRTERERTQGLTAVIPVALSPEDPGSVNVVGGETSTPLTERLMGDANNLVVAVSSILAGVSILTVLATMLSALRQRRHEFGVLLALGATRRSIAQLISIEAVVLGLAGGLLGWAIGVIGAGGVAGLLGWPMVHAAWLWAVPVCAGLVSLLGAVVPAILATRVDPVELIRVT